MSPAYVEKRYSINLKRNMSGISESISEFLRIQFYSNDIISFVIEKRLQLSLVCVIITRSPTLIVLGQSRTSLVNI